MKIRSYEGSGGASVVEIARDGLEATHRWHRTSDRRVRDADLALEQIDRLSDASPAVQEVAKMTRQTLRAAEAWRDAIGGRQTDQARLAIARHALRTIEEAAATGMPRPAAVACKMLGVLPPDARECAASSLLKGVVDAEQRSKAGESLARACAEPALWGLQSFEHALEAVRRCEDMGDPGEFARAMLAERDATRSQSPRLVDNPILHTAPCNQLASAAAARLATRFKSDPLTATVLGLRDTACHLFDLDATSVDHQVLEAVASREAPSLVAPSVLDAALADGGRWGAFTRAADRLTGRRMDDVKLAALEAIRDGRAASAEQLQSVVDRLQPLHDEATLEALRAAAATAAVGPLATPASAASTGLPARGPGGPSVGSATFFLGTQAGVEAMPPRQSGEEAARETLERMSRTPPTMSHRALPVMAVAVDGLQRICLEPGCVEHRELAAQLLEMTASLHAKSRISGLEPAHPLLRVGNPEGDTVNLLRAGLQEIASGARDPMPQALARIALAASAGSDAAVRREIGITALLAAARGHGEAATLAGMALDAVRDKHDNRHARDVLYEEALVTIEETLTMLAAAPRVEARLFLEGILRLSGAKGAMPVDVSALCEAAVSACKSNLDRDGAVLQAIEADQARLTTIVDAHKAGMARIDEALKALDTPLDPVRKRRITLGAVTAGAGAILAITSALAGPAPVLVAAGAACLAGGLGAIAHYLPQRENTGAHGNALYSRQLALHYEILNLQPSIRKNATTLELTARAIERNEKLLELLTLTRPHPPQPAGRIESDEHTVRIGKMVLQKNRS